MVEAFPAKLLLRLYVPDTGTLFLFHPSKIKDIEILPNEAFEWQRRRRYAGLLEELSILIKKPDRELLLRVTLDFFPHQERDRLEECLADFLQEQQNSDL